MRNPWDDPPPVKDWRITGLVAGHGYTSEWMTREQAEKRLANLPPEYGTEFRMESRVELDAAKERAERERLRDAKRRLDAAGEPTVAEAAQELRTRRKVLEIMVYPGQERAPFKTLKAALGHYVAKCKGPKLSQLRDGPPHQPTHAWLVVGSTLTECGYPPGSYTRSALLEWARESDEALPAKRPSGHIKRSRREIREMLIKRGVIEA